MSIRLEIVEYLSVQRVKNIRERHIYAQCRPEPLRPWYEGFGGLQRSLGGLELKEEKAVR